ncbi:MAG: hypothetical protein ACRD38_05815 [Nitrososphaerales archaeon]
MPFLFSARYDYRDNNYQINMEEVVKKFPFLADKIIGGEILATYIDNKITIVRKPFKCRVAHSEQHPNWLGTMLDLNPLREKGIPPCDLCVLLYKYEETQDEKTIELPIMENEIVKAYVLNYFDEIIKKIAKQEEIRIILETTTFHTDIKNLAETLRDAYISFEEEKYPHAKTSCRKILENLRNKAENWQAIDDSKSICENFKRVLNALHSFSSIGGPHEGSSTREETEFILKSVAGAFFYVNSLLKNDRINSNTNKSKSR